MPVLTVQGAGMSPSDPIDVVALTTVPSFPLAAVIVVPRSEGANVFRMRTGMPASTAGRTVRGWMTFAPK